MEQQKTGAERSPETDGDASGLQETEAQGWDLESVSDEASNKSGDEILREVRRGDENQKDVVGSVDSTETAHGREETKNNLPGKANAYD